MSAQISMFDLLDPPPALTIGAVDPDGDVVLGDPGCDGGAQ